jgi:hypothetical protein
MVASSYAIGTNPWNRDDMISHLKEFLNIYKNKPIDDNSGGQKAAQLFYSWYVVKKIKPKIIIESGVFKGQGTWAFEQASPESELICLDPYLEKWGGYRSKKPQYLQKDFKEINWDHIEDKSNVLCFFDDHQNAFNRIVQMKLFGFKVAMFEDNYPEGHGDCLSLKKIFENSEAYQILPELTCKDYLEKVVKCYHELPPICSLAKTRWNTEWNDYRSNKPLLEELNDELVIFQDEMDQYTWINYVEL